MPTPAHSLPATWMQILPTFLHSNELLCDLHLRLYKIQVLPVCMLDFNVPISFTEEEEKEKEEEEESHHHHVVRSHSLPKVVSVCDPPATPDLVCHFPTPDKAKTCPPSTTNKPWIDINLLDRVWKPNKVTMHASLLAAAFLQPCLVLYEGKLTKFSDLLVQIYTPHTHATNTGPLAVFSIGPILMCIRTYIIFGWRKMRDKISEYSGLGTPNSQQFKTSHKNERRRRWGKKRRKRKRKQRRKRRLRKEQGPHLENTRKALETRSGKWRLESKQGEKQTDSGVGSSITASVSQPEQSEPPQHYPNPMKDGPMACAIVMNPMQETESEAESEAESETPAHNQEESLPIAKQEEHCTHSENYGPTEGAGEEDVKPSEIKICPSLCEAEHASIKCNLTSQLPEKVHDSEKHSAVVLPPLSSGTGTLGRSESFTVGGCGEVANYEDTSESDLISRNIINPSNCTKANSHPPEMQESGENEDEEFVVPTCESLSPANCMNSSLEFLSPTHQQRLLLPPCTSETSRHHHRRSVCVASATSSNDASMNYPKYKSIEREAASFSHMHLTGQQPSQEETGDNETVRVESDEGKSGPTAFFLPPRPLQPSHLRPLAPSSDQQPVSIQTRTRGEDLGCNIFSSPCGDTPPADTIMLDTTCYKSLHVQVRK